jgi:hypothetical protein
VLPPCPEGTEPGDPEELAPPYVTAPDRPEERPPDEAPPMPPDALSLSQTQLSYRSPLSSQI